MLLPLDVQLALEEIETDGPEFQLVTGGEGRLQLRVEADDGRGGHLAGALEEALGVPTAVETVPIGSLPRELQTPPRRWLARREASRTGRPARRATCVRAEPRGLTERQAGEPSLRGDVR